jgi:glycosyltransferase involved in cell wall biosynthesis
MRIWIDGQCFQTASRVRGIGRYVIEFIKALHKIPENEVIIGINGSLKEEAITAIGYLKSEMSDISINIWYGIAHDFEALRGYTFQRRSDERIVAAAINSVNPDIAISPSPFEGLYDRTSPFLYPYDVLCPTACIFHDAIPHRFPWYYLQDNDYTAAYYRRLVAVAQFDLVICNSEFTRAEYIDIFGGQNAVSIGAGLPGSIQRLIEGEDDLPPLLSTVSGAYVLYVGGIDWRKNVSSLADAMALVPECQAGELSLVLAGDHPGAELAPIRDLWRGYGLPEDSLITTGWISDAQLVQLYRNASLAVQPSLMEGFGLSALEAMASGCVFLASLGGAVSEVVANDDLLYDGRLPADLAAKISRILEDDSFRNEAIRFGLQRSKEFEWSNSADTAMGAMREFVTHEFLGNLMPVPQGEAIPRLASPRLLMDVTSAAQAPYLTGIQRVVRCLSSALLDAEREGEPEIVLTYADDESGWYRLAGIDRAAISRDPRYRLPMSDRDTYLLLDSSWDFTKAQKPRLLDALVMGQEVIQGVHDIGPLRMPAMVSGGMSPHFRNWFEFVLGHSTGIVCVSRAVADEVYSVIELIKLPRPMNIGYIQLGSDFNDVEPEPGWLDFLGGRPTFIMVGTVEPRKGHSIVLRAFERLWVQGAEVNLLIIGKEGWYTRLLCERLSMHPEVEQRLFLRQDVNDGELRSAYEAATALIMASYLEGFGLPVVEAGRYGCPAILTDLPVFREVGQGAPLTRFFPVGDSKALAEIVMEMAGAEHREYASSPSAWPDWAGTADQIKQIAFGKHWYKQYKPEQYVPNAETDNIGQVGIRDRLSFLDRAHSLRYVEGPMISDDGHEMQFIVAIGNLGSKMWSSRSGIGGGLEINVGSHIYAKEDKCLDFENARSPIPFVLGPGEEMLVPIRLSTNWLAHGASRVDVELVQESVGWFGNPLCLSLVQSLNVGAISRSIGAISDIVGVVIRPPYRIASDNKMFVTIALVNKSYNFIDLSHVNDQDIDTIIKSSKTNSTLESYRWPPDGRASVEFMCSYIDPLEFGLMTISFSSLY